jgi:hypothetical protein
MREAGVCLGKGNSSCPALINTPHSAIESLWFKTAAIDIANRLEELFKIRPELTVSTLNTDPWTLHLATTATH